MPWLEPFLYYLNYPSVNSFWERIRKERGGEGAFTEFDVTEGEKICLQ